jgi:hypothetical protein
MRCGSEDGKSTGYFGSKFCGQTKCLNKKEGKVSTVSSARMTKKDEKVIQII